MWLRWLAVLLLSWAANGADRPRYGASLRVEIRASVETADPPRTGFDLANLGPAFSITRWEGGKLAVYSADQDAPGGRPYLDSVEIQMGRPYREQAIDLELGRADIVELGLNEMRTPGAGRRVWSSEPVRLVALVFGSQVSDARLREAVALSVDRGAIYNVLLQHQGEMAGGLLPQWISGYAFLFPTAADPAKARGLAAALPPAARTLTLRADDPAWRAVADRIAVNARDAGLTLSPASNANADLRLAEFRISSADPGEALAALAATLGLPEPPRASSLEVLFSAERAYLADFRIIPLFHLPVTYGVGPRVRGGPGISPLGEWHFENLWLETARP
jgi:peptide/nickel transport system substrate-binding protein